MTGTTLIQIDHSFAEKISSNPTSFVLALLQNLDCHAGHSLDAYGCKVVMQVRSKAATAKVTSISMEWAEIPI